MPQLEQGVSVIIDPLVWYKLKKDLDAAEKGLSVALRRRLKNAGQVAADAVKRQLASGSTGGAPAYDAATAKALELATKVTVSFSARAAGVKITTSGKLLTQSDQGLVKAYNREEFRHPVFPKGSNRRLWKWVPQKAKPYFSDPIRAVLDTAMRTEIEAALDDAFAKIPNHISGRSL